MILETYTGLAFDYDRPRADMIAVEDIARSLSQQARFLGHIKADFSVADHARLVRTLVRVAGGDDELQLAALHHDSHEAYIGDLPTPLKAALRAESKVYDNMRLDIDEAIGEALGIKPRLFDHSLVKQADADALYLEAQMLKHSNATSQHWAPQQAAWSGVEMPSLFMAGERAELSEQVFLVCHNHLSRRLADA